jgi:hypothetical protein
MDTMTLNRIVALCLALTLSATVALADKTTAVKSGPQVGEKLAGPFHPLNVNGPSAGEKACLYCSNGTNPVAMVFARETSPALTALVKKLDAACEKNTDCKMGSFVVFCSSEEGLEARLKKMAKDAGLKNVVLSIDNPAGPKKYNVSKDADVTVVLYTDHTVKANYSFKKGEMKDKDVEKVIKDLDEILPKKK